MTTLFDRNHSKREIPLTEIEDVRHYAGEQNDCEIPIAGALGLADWALNSPIEPADEMTGLKISRVVCVVYRADESKSAFADLGTGNEQFPSAGLQTVAKGRYIRIRQLRRIVASGGNLSSTLQQRICRRSSDNRSSRSCWTGLRAQTSLVFWNASMTPGVFSIIGESRHLRSGHVSQRCPSIGMSLERTTVSYHSSGGAELNAVSVRRVDPGRTRFFASRHAGETS